MGEARQADESAGAFGIASRSAQIGTDSRYVLKLNSIV